MRFGIINFNIEPPSLLSVGLETAAMGVCVGSAILSSHLLKSPLRPGEAALFGASLYSMGSLFSHSVIHITKNVPDENIRVYLRHASMIAAYFVGTVSAWSATGALLPSGKTFSYPDALALSGTTAGFFTVIVIPTILFTTYYLVRIVASK